MDISHCTRAAGPLVVSLLVALVAPAHALAFQVTGATARVEPPVLYTATCPVSYTLVGTITVDGPGTVTYRWGHSPGTGLLQSVTFPPGGPLTKTVTLNEQCSPYAGSWSCDFRELYTYSPNEVGAIVSLDHLACGTTVTALSGSVSPVKYVGNCPQKFTFTGRITTNGPGRVNYIWIHNPYVRQPGDIEFAAAGTKTVSYEWLVDKNLPPGEQWLKFVVNSPNHNAGEPTIGFSMECRSVGTFVPRKPPPKIQKRQPVPPPAPVQ